MNKVCIKCSGTGIVTEFRSVFEKREDRRQVGDRVERIRYPCPTCNGKGYVAKGNPVGCGGDS